MPIIVFTLITLWSAIRTQNTLHQELVNQINDEMAALSEIYISSGVESVSGGIAQRLTLSPLNRAGAHYKFVSRGGDLLAGDLVATSEETSDITKVITAPNQDFGTLLMRSTVFKGGEVLTVARETEAQRRALRGGLLDYLIGVSAILILSFAFVFLSIRNLRRRLARMNSVFVRVGDGDTDARLTPQERTDELTVLGEHINTMIARMARLLTLRKRVTDQVAHEMRSPLTRLDASLVRVEKLVGEQTEIDQARDELKHCIALLDGLLDISSLDAQQGDKRGFEEVNLSLLIRSITDLFEPLAEDENRDLEISVEPDCCVFGASSQLGRLVSNLLDNAIKYATEGTTITVSLVREGSYAVLRVANRGAPISAETARDIFTPFFRNTDMAEKKGYGLGLALSRAIATRHDGFLDLEPTPKEVVFKLTIPILLGT